MTTYYDRHPRLTQRATRFMAVGKEENGMHPMAHVDLLHEEEKSNFFMGMPINATQEGEPNQMFSNRPARLHGAFADPSMTSHIPTLLGMAGERSMRDTGGRLPMPSHSLSEHSSRMVQGLRDRGVNFPENPKNSGDAQTNTIQKKDYLATPEDIGYDAMPTPLSQVRSGRELMRSMLRPKAQNISDNQFKHYNNLPMAKNYIEQHLPGMDPTDSPSYQAMLKSFGLGSK
jgi:hypothetical protein